MDGRSSTGPIPDREPTQPNGAGRPNRPHPDRARREPARPDLPVHPLANGPTDPPPPAREQLPLPRRHRQAHIEPQLRTPSGAGTGTPFAAFAATEPGPPADTDRDVPREFREGSQRARWDTRHRTRPAQ